MDDAALIRAAYGEMARVGVWPTAAVPVIRWPVQRALRGERPTLNAVPISEPAELLTFKYETGARPNLWSDPVALEPWFRVICNGFVVEDGRLDAPTPDTAKAPAA